MTKTVKIEEAEGHLAELVASIGENDEVILEKSGRPVAKVVALRHRPETKQRRTWGGYEGLVRMSDDFADPLPDDFWFGEGDPPS